MKKTIRLTESDLHNIVKESVRRILMEEVDTGQVKAAWEKEQKPPESPRVKRIRQEIARLRREIDKAEKAGENIKPIQDQIKLLKKQAGFTNVDESRENNLRNIVKESVRRVINEHVYGDEDFDEDDFYKTVNYKYDPNDEGDMYGMMFGGKEEEIRNILHHFRLHPSISDWFWDDNGKEYYFAGYLLNILCSNKNTASKKRLEDMYIDANDIYYLLRTGKDERLISIYRSLSKPEEEPEKPEYDSSPLMWDSPGRSLYNAARKGIEGNDLGSTHPDIYANMNVYDVGGNGSASLAAQGDRGEKNIARAQSFMPTMQQSYQAGKKLRGK